MDAKEIAQEVVDAHEATRVAAASFDGTGVLDGSDRRDKAIQALAVYLRTQEPLGDERLNYILEHMATSTGNEVHTEIRRLQAEVKTTQDEADLANDGAQFYNRRAADAIVLRNAAEAQLQTAEQTIGWVKAEKDSEQKRAEGLFNTNCSLKQQLQTTTVALEAAREDGAEWERLADMCNRQVCEMDTRLERELRFHEGLAAECEAAGSDFARGRACGIKELTEDIRKAIPPPAAAEPQAEHPDTAQLATAMDLLSRAVTHIDEGPPPDAQWFGDYFELTGDHMILTDEGWEPGSAKKVYLEQYEQDPKWGYPILDEINVPIDAARSAGEKEKAPE